MKYWARVPCSQSKAGRYHRFSCSAFSNFRQDTLSLCLCLSIAVNQCSTSSTTGNWKKAVTSEEKTQSCLLPNAYIYMYTVCVRVCACMYCMYTCIFASVCFPVCLTACHVAHLVLSSCLTLGLSWISLGPRWQWSRQHRFGSCHMGRLQGNGAVSVSSELQALL